MRHLMSILWVGLGLVALGGLYIALCVGPKAAGLAIELHSILPDWVSFLLSVTRQFPISLLLVLGAFMVAAGIVSLMPVGRLKGYSVCALVCAVSGTFLLAISLLVGACAGMVYVNQDQHDKLVVYGAVLDRFSLVESANARFDQLQQTIAAMTSARMVEVSDANSLSKEQQSEYLRAITDTLTQSHDVTFLKQVLATSDLFRPTIAGDSNRTKLVLKAAATCGAPAENLDEFYSWVEAKKGTDGWVRLPLSVLVIGR
jgi:hypothetical protein